MLKTTLSRLLPSVDQTAKTAKPVAARCRADLSTRMRLKYSPYYHVVERTDGVNIVVDGRPMLMMSSNEYLGQSTHPDVCAAAKAAIDEWGTSSCGSRMANGSRGYHRELEEELAAFLGKEACHVSVAGYMACLSALSSLAQRGDALIVDKQIHASLWDAARLSGADIERFAHEDMNSLRQLLGQLPADQAKLIAIDGVYSMEGHIASLPEIVELADAHGAFIVVDDCHGLGVLGRDGRGVANHFGLDDEVDLIVGSFSKSLASTGGFLAGDKAVIEYLRSTCRQIIFSAALTPPAAAERVAPSPDRRVVMRVRPRAGAPGAAVGEHPLPAKHPPPPRPGLLGQPDAGRAHRHRRQGESLRDVALVDGPGLLHGDVHFARRARGQGPAALRRERHAHPRAARPLRRRAEGGDEEGRPPPRGGGGVGGRSAAGPPGFPGLTAPCRKAWCARS